MAVNDLDDDILEELKSINNLLERVAASSERTAKSLEQMMEMYRQAAAPRR